MRLNCNPAARITSYAGAPDRLALPKHFLEADQRLIMLINAHLNPPTSDLARPQGDLAWTQHWHHDLSRPAWWVQWRETHRQTPAVVEHITKLQVQWIEEGGTWCCTPEALLTLFVHQLPQLRQHAAQWDRAIQGSQPSAWRIRFFLDANPLPVDVLASIIDHASHLASQVSVLEQALPKALMSRLLCGVAVDDPSDVDVLYHRLKNPFYIQKPTMLPVLPDQPMRFLSAQDFSTTVRVLLNAGTLFRSAVLGLPWFQSTDDPKTLVPMQGLGGALAVPTCLGRAGVSRIQHYRRWPKWLRWFRRKPFFSDRSRCYDLACLNAQGRALERLLNTPIRDDSATVVAFDRQLNRLLEAIVSTRTEVEKARQTLGVWSGASRKALSRYIDVLDTVQANRILDWRIRLIAKRLVCIQHASATLTPEVLKDLDERIQRIKRHIDIQSADRQAILNIQWQPYQSVYASLRAAFYKRERIKTLQSAPPHTIASPPQTKTAVRAQYTREDYLNHFQTWLADTEHSASTGSTRALLIAAVIYYQSHQRSTVADERVYCQRFRVALNRLSDAIAGTFKDAIRRRGVHTLDARQRDRLTDQMTLLVMSREREWIARARHQFLEAFIGCLTPYGQLRPKAEEWTESGLLDQLQQWQHWMKAAWPLAEHHPESWPARGLVCLDAVLQSHSPADLERLLSMLCRARDEHRLAKHHQLIRQRLKEAAHHHSRRPSMYWTRLDAFVSKIAAEDSDEGFTESERVLWEAGGSSYQQSVRVLATLSQAERSLVAAPLTQSACTLFQSTRSRLQALMPEVSGALLAADPSRRAHQPLLTPKRGRTQLH